MKISFESTSLWANILHRYKNWKLEAGCLQGTLRVLVQLFDLVDVLGVKLGNVFPKVPLYLLQHNH